MKICPECGGDLREVVIYCNPSFNPVTGGVEILELVELECEDCKTRFSIPDETEEVIF